MPLRNLACFLLLCLVAACEDATSPKSLDSSVVPQLPDASNEADAEGPPACEGEDDGEPCGEVPGWICLAEACVVSSCGDGFVDEALGEECDDGNLTSGDGCEMSCLFTCHTDEDCSDGNACTGIERCVPGGHGQVCENAEPVDCHKQLENTSECNIYVCNPEDGICAIESSLVLCYRDEDGDGYPSEIDTAPTLDECLECPTGYILPRADRLWDCNDRNATAYPGQRQFFTVPHCGPEGALNAQAAIVAGNFQCGGEGAPSFDYDCSGDEELRDTSSGGFCSSQVLWCGETLEAWDRATPPACGQSAAYVKCINTGLLGCHKKNPAEVRTQECR